MLKKVELLRIKLMKESALLAKKQCAQGNDDLRFMLSDFRKKIKKDNIAKFDHEVLNIRGTPHPSANEIKATSGDSADQTGIVKTNKKKINHLKWAKALYKKIVTQTHPDKISSLSIDTLKDKLVGLYMESIVAYNNKEYGSLILIADDLNIHFEINSAMQEFLIQLEAKYVNDYNKAIQEAGYSWFHVPDVDKPIFLRNYLEKMGYEFDDDQIKKVLKNIKARRVGKRPQRSVKNRILK